MEEMDKMLFVHDDTIFFSSTREKDLQTLKSLLLVFERIFGLKVNLDKSLPLGGNPKACGFWDPVIERISRRLDGWKKAYLSFGNGHTVVLGRLLHKSPKSFPSLLRFVVGDGEEFDSGKTCGGGPTFGSPISKTI
ncbi:hypothetical protein CK203_073584 [Vitis vinifera]|uniref:Reverse transcriptase domain-containing protein n=1 Tax=Vitis vinifera TaxID=29760 RepID=A0A438DUI0_VITVI|nr:hypothetical protein CK203_073584 [Vitis vinifera]